MTNIDATTPQLKVVKGVFDGYCSLNVKKNVLPLLAEDFQVQLFPKTPGFPDGTREEHIEMWAKSHTLLTKLEVRIWHQEPSLPHAT